MRYVVVFAVLAVLAVLVMAVVVVRIKKEDAAQRLQKGDIVEYIGSEVDFRAAYWYVLYAAYGSLPNYVGIVQISGNYPQIFGVARCDLEKIDHVDIDVSYVSRFLGWTEESKAVLGPWMDWVPEKNP